MSRYMAICRCSGMREKAEAAFRIQYPNQDLPPLYRGEDAIRALAEQNPNTNLSRYLRAIAKKNGRYAYYIEENNGDVSLSVDLMTGKRLA